MDSTVDDIEASYDDVPYGPRAHRFTHPTRLASVARSNGVMAAPVAACRVLELGCAEGANLAPIAARHPAAHVVGIDLSGEQIRRGLEVIEPLALDNIELRQLDIVDAGPSLGEFDHIICHGVYSWVPPAVQRRTLELIRELLAPNGVAVVSYNVADGWGAQSVLRRVALRCTADIEDRRERAAVARAAFADVAAAVDRRDPYGAWLGRWADHATQADDGYLLGEYLSACNEPVPVGRFIERATAAGLRWVDDAIVPDARAGVGGHGGPLTPDEITALECFDEVNGTAFRAAVLCRDDLAPMPAPPGLSATPWVASVLRLESAFSYSYRTTVRFAGAAGAHVDTTEPIVKCVLRHLAERWPADVHVDELLERARSDLGRLLPQVTHGDPVAHLARELRALHVRGLVELSCEPLVTDAAPGAHPMVAPVVRRYAELGLPVVDRRHGMVDLDPAQRRLVVSLDGTRTRAELGIADDALAQLARLALLEPPGHEEEGSVTC